MEQCKTERILWIDTSRAIACILVVIGHLLKGLASANIYTGTVSDGIIRTLYFFHVQVFFFCSGFLYRKRCETGVLSWGKNILKKLVDLGIPFVAFTIVSHVLKKLFENDVNFPTHATLARRLFIKPDAPYWFLYILFFMFLLIPPVKSRKLLIGFAAVCFAMFVISEFVFLGRIPYFAEYFMTYAVWFAAGMVAAEFGFSPGRVNIIKALTGFLFIPASIAVCALGIQFPLLNLIMGAWGIWMTVVIASLLTACIGEKTVSVASLLTMPIFLMHTIAAPMARIVLLKLGVTSPVIHIILGFIAGVLLPSAAYCLMHLLILPEFFIYPRKTLKRIRNRKKPA